MIADFRQQNRVLVVVRGGISGLQQVDDADDRAAVLLILVRVVMSKFLQDIFIAVQIVQILIIGTRKTDAERVIVVRVVVRIIATPPPLPPRDAEHGRRDCRHFCVSSYAEVYVGIPINQF